MRVEGHDIRYLDRDLLSKVAEFGDYTKFDGEALCVEDYSYIMIFDDLYV